MNLRPLILSLSLLAVAAPVALAQQMPPQETSANDLGLSPAQMADLAGPADESSVVYAGAEQPQFAPRQAYAGPMAIPTDPNFAQPPMTGMPPAHQPSRYQSAGYQPAGYPSSGYEQPAYQLQLTGALAPAPNGPAANPQLGLSAPMPGGPPAINPNWPNANIPQPMIAGPPPGYGCGSSAGTPAGFGPETYGTGPLPGVDPYGGAAPTGLATSGTPARPCWYLRGDSVWLNRSRPDNHNLTAYENLNNAKDPFNFHFLLSTDTVTYPLEPGMRLTLGRYITDTTMIEATYYGGVDWDRRNGTANFPTGANGLGPLLPYWGPGFGAFDTGAFTGSNVQIASYESQFNSFELGVRHAIWGTTSILAGFRYMNIGDLFQLAAFDNSTNSNPDANGFYRTWTNNNLVGVQLGTEYSHDLWFPRLFVSVDCRGGIYANFAEQKNLLFNSGDTWDQRSAREVQFASAWDLTFTLSYLATDHLTIRGGYTFLFIDGIALAPDQLDTNPTMQNARNFIADNGTLTLQGPFVGAELAW